MSEEVRKRLKAGEELPIGSMKIPMIDLPLGATEDRVCGTIDIEKALTEGELVVGWRRRGLLVEVSAGHSCVCVPATAATATTTRCQGV
jgi:hypothetical protein